MGDHRLMILSFAWVLVLAVLFVLGQGYARALYRLLGTSVQKRDGFGLPFFVFRVTFLERMYQVANTAPFAQGGLLTLHVVGEMTWGKPLSGES